MVEQLRQKVSDAFDRTVTVTEDEERGAVAGFNILLPAAFALLLMIGVMGHVPGKSSLVYTPERGLLTRYANGSIVLLHRYTQRSMERDVQQ